METMKQEHQPIVVSEKVFNILEELKVSPIPSGTGYTSYMQLNGVVSKLIIEDCEYEATIVEIANALMYGYRKEFEFINFQQAIKEMKKGKKVNVQTDKGAKIYSQPLHIHGGEICWGSHNFQQGNAFAHSESEKWYVVE